MYMHIYSLHTNKCKPLWHTYELNNNNNSTKTWSSTHKQYKIQIIKFINKYIYNIYKIIKHSKFKTPVILKFLRWWLIKNFFKYYNLIDNHDIISWGHVITEWFHCHTNASSNNKAIWKKANPFFIIACPQNLCRIIQKSQELKNNYCLQWTKHIQTIY